MKFDRSPVLSLALLAGVLGACDSETPKTDPEFPAAAAADLQEVLDGVVAAGVAPGVSLTLYHPVHQRFVGTAGLADRAKNRELTADHRFRAGSMLKVAVATAVLQLVEQNKLGLDQRLTELVPSATAAGVPDAAGITLRMLLDHTAGLPEFSTEDFDRQVVLTPRRVWGITELLERSAAGQRQFPPGEGWAYSNTHYVLLGEVIEQATGEPWREIVKDRVLDRAGLEHSSLPRPGHASCPGCARGYEPDGEGAALLDLTEVDPSMAGAAGGDALISTPDDLARLLRALDAGELFDEPGTLATMKSFVEAPRPEEAQTHYGLGLTRFQLGDLELIGHLGGTAGYQGFVLKDTAAGVVVSGIMNQRGDLGAFIVPVLETMAQLP